MAVGDRRREDPRSLQVAAWRGRRDVVVLSPRPELAGPGPATVARAVERLRADGVQRVLTAALHEHEVGAFQAAGFELHERLHLLRRDLGAPPAPGAERPVRLRRCWRRDLDAVLAVDARAFEPFWSLDRQGLDDALRATPVSRHRVAIGPAGAVVGYAVTGQAADRGYLQRLAVDPDHHRLGIGRALVADALGWLVRRGCRSAVVNTQETNAGALALYEACGFVTEPLGLVVLRLDLAGEPGVGPSGPPGASPC